MTGITLNESRKREQNVAFDAETITLPDAIVDATRSRAAAGPGRPC